MTNVTADYGPRVARGKGPRTTAKGPLGLKPGPLGLGLGAWMQVPGVSTYFFYPLHMRYGYAKYEPQSAHRG